MNELKATLDEGPRSSKRSSALARLLAEHEAERHRIEQELADLTETMLKIAGGDFSARWNRASSNDALGVLAFLANNTAAEVGRIFEDAERERARRQVSDRMAMMGTVAAGVAHEINNPLAFVLANVELVVERLGDAAPPEVKDALADALFGAKRVRDIVRDLKTFSRADDTVSERVDVNATVASSLHMIQGEVRHHARVVLDLHATSAVDASAARLGQVFLNLIHNASQAIPEGNAAANEIRIASRDEVSSGGAGSGAVSVVVEVSDTGAGIPPDVLPHIFEAFYTTKPIGVGTGLGLSVCQSVVVALGGTIEVSSVVGRGTTFRVRLPAAPPAVASSSARGAVAPRSLRRPPSIPPSLRAPRPEGRPRVLVIDDEESLAKSLRRVLDRKHDVTVITRSSEAFATLTFQDFDVILCDLMMPDVTGMDVYDWVCARRPELADRFVFMSGGAFSTAATRFLEEVPNARFGKPFAIAEVRAAVRDVLARVIDTATADTPGS